jgi:tetratricopeptide (TPR) repeat protein
MIRSVPREALAGPIRDASDARRFASVIIRARQQDNNFDAQAVLGEFPELEGYGSAVLDLVYEEFSRRADSGEELDSHAFADRFPQFRSAILEHIRAHQLLERCFGDKNPKWPEPGDVVLGCHLQEEIGRGAFSRVFLASQAALGGRKVVLKFCPSGAHEAQLLGKLEHEHIVQVHAVETDPERRLNAIVMPFHGRATLRDVIDHCFSADAAPRTAAQIAEAVSRINGNVTSDAPGKTVNGSYVDAVERIILDVACGLAHAHRKGVLHADIKPTNVLITATLRAKLLDFNLSHDSDALTNMTGGTVPYMAPEQLLALARRGEPTPTVAADLYAFGATLYETLAGRSPYGAIPSGLDRTMLADWLLKRRQEGWCTLPEAAPHVPGPICSLVARCLSFDPRERPAAIEDVAAILAREQHPAVRLLRRVQRNRLPAAVAGGLAATALAAAIAAFALADPAHVVHFNKGHRYYLQQKYAAAVQQFDAAEDCLPVDASSQVKFALWFERGRARLHLQNTDAYDSAWEDFELAVKLNPDHAASHACLGYAYLIELSHDANARVFPIQFEKALAEFQEARRDGLDTPELRYDIAYCRSRMRTETVAGIKELQLIASDPDVPESVVAAALLSLVRADLAQPASVAPRDSIDPRALNLANLLNRVEHSSAVFEIAGCAYLQLAQIQTTHGVDSGAAVSVDAALACFRSALRHGSSRSGIDRIRDSFPLIRHDPRFLDLTPDGGLIESTPEPRAVLDPLASVSPESWN